MQVMICMEDLQVVNQVTIENIDIEYLYMTLWFKANNIKMNTYFIRTTNLYINFIIMSII